MAFLFCLSYLLELLVLLFGDDMSCMKEFYSLNEFYKFIRRYVNETKWRIYEGKLNNRAKNVAGTWYFDELKQMFNNKNLFRRSVSMAEIVSWMDNFIILERFIGKIVEKQPISILNNIKVKMEYVLEFSKLMRVDFAFSYKNRVLFLEFRTVNSFDIIKSTWEKKRLEQLIYKDIASLYLSDETKILSYVFISIFEYSNHKLIVKNKEYNLNQIDYFISFFIEIFIHNKTSIF